MSLSSVILGYSPIAYWKLDETSGTVVTNYGSLGAGANGVYTGVTLANIAAPVGAGGLAPLFDGANDYANLYTTVLRDAFDESEFTLSTFIRVDAVGTWTDGTTNAVLRLLANVSANDIYLTKNANNQIACIYYAGSTLKSVSITGLSSTDWLHIALVVSKSGNYLKAYLNGSQVGTTQTGLGTWANAISLSTFGSFSLVPASPWQGYLSHYSIHAPLSDANIAAIYAASNQQTYSMSADAGSITVTGQDATLTANQKRGGTVTAGDTCLYTVTASDMACT